MLHHLASWIRSESRKHRPRGHWARWLGRNWARVSYGYRIEPTWLEVNRIQIAIADLPSAFTGFRIAQLSDFHAGKHVTSAYLEEAIAMAHAERPDLVVLTGDFVHVGYRYVETVAQCLGALQAPFGVYAVLGNHDFSVRNALGIRRYKHLSHAVAKALQNRGIHVLQNESRTLAKEGQSLHLVGVDDLWSRSCDLERAFADLPAITPTIVLAHNPRTVERLTTQRCDLMLSGHTHGGQVRLAGIGTPTLGRKARRFAAGLYSDGNTQLYVNKGVGFGFRFRYGVRPEIAIFTLHSGGSTASA
jgi:predicted MPP superfamily phosphohydrolase